MSIILTVLDILFLLVGIIYILKNIIINYKLSDSGLKNGCITVLICIMVWFAGNGAILGVKLTEVQDTLKYIKTNGNDGYENINIKSVEANINANKKEVIKYTAISAGSFVAFVVLTKNVEKEMREKPTTSKWDLAKFK